LFDSKELKRVWEKSRHFCVYKYKYNANGPSRIRIYIKERTNIGVCLLSDPLRITE